MTGTVRLGTDSTHIGAGLVITRTRRIGKDYTHLGAGIGMAPAAAIDGVSYNGVTY